MNSSRSFEGVGFGVGALLLELLDLGQGLFQGAVEALLVQAQAGEQVGALISPPGLPAASSRNKRKSSNVGANSPLPAAP